MIEYDPNDLEIVRDPYPCYHSIRSEESVHWNPLLQSWMVLGYEAVQAALLDSRFSARKTRAFMKRAPDEVRDQLGRFAAAADRMLAFIDPPDHDRIRSLSNKAFSPRTVKNLRPKIEGILEECLADVRDKPHFDWIEAVAYPLPALVIADLFGLPREDRDLVKRWSSRISPIVTSPKPDAESARIANDSLAELEDYLKDVIRERRKRPGEDLISRLITAEEQGMLLDELEVVANGLQLLIGGHETTTNLIGSGMLALLQYPGERKRLCEEPDRVDAAVEEMLRYESPLQLVTRLAGQDMEFAGREMTEGQTVLLVVGAANRDPATYPHPDRFDIARDNRTHRHLAFGHGMHFCIGAPLARLEAQITFSTAMQRLPGLALASDAVEWRRDLGFRGLVELPVSA